MKSCSIVGCGRPLLARTWCGLHYKRWEIHGAPEWIAPDRRAERFWAKVDKSAGSIECWPWTAYRDRDGYGRVATAPGHTTTAHRVAYELTHGTIPAGLTIDHLCRTRACCNPAHLEPTTQGENTLRGLAPTAIHARQVVCSKGHAFDEANTYLRRTRYGTSRQCRACARERDHRRKLARP